ncbi:unnamed protein product [Effrenium voratum]|uniref:Uncharacterized protein n=1 Tax=Effrenium voratum TaxID=2562239 RepID=A0AA36HSB5_9DINO|nr:unnamed protein product [Effrenium voratum]CAJ1424761.1 unnamed protein product [Effrenium voratum]
MRAFGRRAAAPAEPQCPVLPLRDARVTPTPFSAQTSATSHENTVTWCFDAELVWPLMGFYAEHSIPVLVNSVSTQPFRGFESTCLMVTGEVQRSRLKPREANAAPMPVVLTLAPRGDASSEFYVVGVQGSSSLNRCSKEAWLAVRADGLPFTPALGGALQPGAVLLLQRPERVYVLRSPEEQLSRLLMDLAQRRGLRLFAAPAGYGAVALLGEARLAEGLPELRAQIQQQFSIVLAHCEPIPTVKASEAILRRLIASGARHVLCQDAWQSVEFPYRLFHSQALSTDARRSSRVPCVDVACTQVKASAKVVAQLAFSPAVRLTQPLAPFLARAEEAPDLAGDFRLEGGRAVRRPTIHVLPRLTPAEISHIWVGHMPPAAHLPEELRSKEHFAEYWRLIHGMTLPSHPTAFARVEFGANCREANLVLTYPVVCLWRTPWTEQPALSRQHGPNILRQVVQSLEKSSWARSTVSYAEDADPLCLHLPAKPASPLKPKLERAETRSHQQSHGSSTQHTKTDVSKQEDGQSGKRRLILPVLPVSSQPAKRRR